MRSYVSWVFIASLLLISQAFGEDNKGAPVNAFRFLNAYNDARGIQLALEGFIAKIEGAKATAKKDQTLYEMYQERDAQGSVSARELRFSKLNATLSGLRVKQFEHIIEGLKANYEADLLQAEASTGRPLTLEKIYPVYHRDWMSQCEKAKVDISMAEAELDFADFELKSMEPLRRQGSVSETELLEKRTNYTIAVTTLQSAQRWSGECATHIPTLEFLKKLPGIPFY